MPSKHNREIRERIAALEKQREGMSYGSIDYPRITAEIQALALQLKQEPRWFEIPGFWVTVIAMLASCAAAYFSYLAVFHQGTVRSSPAHKSENVSPATPNVIGNSHKQSESTLPQ